MCPRIAFSCLGLFDINRTLCRILPVTIAGRDCSPCQRDQHLCAQRSQGSIKLPVQERREFQRFLKVLISTMIPERLISSEEVPQLRTWNRSMGQCSDFVLTSCHAQRQGLADRRNHKSPSVFRSLCLSVSFVLFRESVWFCNLDFGLAIRRLDIRSWVHSSSFGATHHVEDSIALLGQVIEALEEEPRPSNRAKSSTAAQKTG
eukprot:1580984-Amphidinium_carterae.1